MATILQLKRRIQTAQNVSKTTRAMQMIAASKLKRGQQQALSTRPYVEKLTSLSQNVLTKVENKADFAYLQENQNTDRTLCIVISPDKGLAGGLITNLAREFVQLDRSTSDICYISVGKKIEGLVTATGKEVLASFPFGTTLPTFDVVFPLMEIINRQFLGGNVRKVVILHQHFVSLFSQKSFTTTLLPIEVPTEHVSQTFSLFEPQTQDLLPPLLKHYVEMTLYSAFIESYASEQASRMLAMQNATDNARDIISELKLLYNKQRQEKITNEILDIGSAANTFVTA